MAVKEKIRIRIKGYDHQLVDQSSEKIVATAKRTGARVSGPVPLPTEKQVITILRAVHKYKDSREQFELRTHKRLIQQQDCGSPDGPGTPRRRRDRNQAVRESRLQKQLQLSLKGFYLPRSEGHVGRPTNNLQEEKTNEKRNHR